MVGGVTEVVSAVMNQYSVAVAHGEREFYCLLAGACSGYGQRLLGKKCCYGTTC